MMHRTHPSFHRLVSSEDAVQKECATTDQQRRSKDDANGMNDRVDGHKPAFPLFYALSNIMWWFSISACEKTKREKEHGFSSSVRPTHGGNALLDGFMSVLLSLKSYHIHLTPQLRM